MSREEQEKELLQKIDAENIVIKRIDNEYIIKGNAYKLTEVKTLGQSLEYARINELTPRLLNLIKFYDELKNIIVADFFGSLDHETDDKTKVNLELHKWSSKHGDDYLSITQKLTELDKNKVELEERYGFSKQP